MQFDSPNEAQYNTYNKAAQLQRTKAGRAMWRVKGDKGELRLKRALFGAVQCAQRSQGQRGLLEETLRRTTTNNA